MTRRPRSPREQQRRQDARNAVLLLLGGLAFVALVVAHLHVNGPLR